MPLRHQRPLGGGVIGLGHVEPLQCHNQYRRENRRNCHIMLIVDLIGDQHHTSSSSTLTYMGARPTPIQRACWGQSLFVDWCLFIYFGPTVIDIIIAMIRMINNMVITSIVASRPPGGWANRVRAAQSRGAIWPKLNTLHYKGRYIYITASCVQFIMTKALFHGKCNVKFCRFKFSQFQENRIGWVLNTALLRVIVLRRERVVLQIDRSTQVQQTRLY